MTRNKDKRPACKSAPDDDPIRAVQASASEEERSAEPGNSSPGANGPAAGAAGPAGANGPAAGAAGPAGANGPAAAEAPDAAADAEAAGNAETAAAGDVVDPESMAQDEADARQAASGVEQQVAAEEPQEQLQDLVAERDGIREQLLRAAADLDNYRKRARREVQEAQLRGKEDAIRELLPVFDNLERAIAAADEAQDAGSVVEGVRMVFKLFADTAERLGLRRVPGIGERFDPAVHEALQRVETTEHPTSTVIAEVTPGYVLGERLLRPAMVVVAQAPPAPSPGAQEQSSSGDETSAVDGDTMSSSDEPKGDAS